MSAHIHWRRRLSSLSSQGGAIRRHTRTRIGLHSPLITLPANQRREVSAAVSQSRYYNIPERKNGLSISGAGEQPVTCLNAHYFLGTPPLLVEVRTHSARHTVSIWREDNLSPGETLPTMGWEDAETHTTKHLGIVARSREGGEGRTGSEARASHVPGRDAEGQICRGRKQAAMAALTAPARSDRKPGPADSLGAPLPSSRTEAKSVLDREPWQPGTTSSPGTLLFLLASAASFGRGARHRPQEDARPTSCLSLSLSHGNPFWPATWPGIPLWHCGKGFPGHLPLPWQYFSYGPWGRQGSPAITGQGGCHHGWLETRQTLQGVKATLSPHRHAFPLTPVPSPRYLDPTHGSEVVPGPGSGRQCAHRARREAAGSGNHPSQNQPSKESPPLQRLLRVKVGHWGVKGQ